MLQAWADMVDAWIDGRTHVPKLQPENLVVPVLSAVLYRQAGAKALLFPVLSVFEDLESAPN